MKKILIFLIFLINIPVNAQNLNMRVTPDGGSTGGGSSSSSRQKGPSPGERVGTEKTTVYKDTTSPPTFQPRPLTSTEKAYKTHWENMEHDLVEYRHQYNELKEYSQNYPDNSEWAPGVTKQQMRETALRYAEENLQAAETISKNRNWDYLTYVDDLEYYYVIARDFLNFASNFTPGVSWFRDCWEFVTGRDLFTNEELNAFERTLAGVGVASAGFMSSPAKALGVFKRRNYYVSQEVLKQILYSKSAKEIDEALSFVRKYKIYGGSTNHAICITNAFLKGAKRRVLKEDLKVYRYYKPGGRADPRGYWVTTSKLADPVEELALKYPKGTVLECEEWVIKKGTEIMEGIVAPQAWEGGKMGGAYQILVDKFALVKEIIE